MHDIVSNTILYLQRRVINSWIHTAAYAVICGHNRNYDVKDYNQSMLIIALQSGRCLIQVQVDIASGCCYVKISSASPKMARDPYTNRHMVPVDYSWHK